MPESDIRQRLATQMQVIRDILSIASKPECMQ
jgi:hypothetical protein